MNKCGEVDLSDINDFKDLDAEYRKARPITFRCRRSTVSLFRFRAFGSVEYPGT